MAGLSRKRRKTWRRKLAGFLAVCMMATSIQSSAFATTEGEYESSSEEVVLDLSMEYMKEAIKESIEYGIHYSGDMAFSDAEGKASKYEEFLSGENVFELVSIPYADTVLYDAMPDDTSLRIFVRADEGQLKKMEQKASEAELKATDDALFAPEYEILGSEEIIFLFTNGSDVDYSFKLNVDGHFTPVIKVPSGETLGYEVASESEAEEETEEETTAEETTAAEETAEGVGPSGETGGTVTDDGAGFGGGSGSGSGSGSGTSEIVDDADNQTDETTTTDDSNKNDGTGSEEGSSEGSVTAPEEGNGSSEEVNSGSDTSEEQGSAEGGQTDNSTTNSDGQTSEGTDGSGSVSDNGVASDNGASSDNGTASEPGASSDNGTVSDNGASSEKKEEVKETKVEIVRPETSKDSADSDDGEQSASIVSYNIPRVTATLDGEEETSAHVGPNTDPNSDYVDDDMDWDDWFSADDDEDEYYSENSSNDADSFTVVESGTILEPVFVKTESQAKGFARFALFAAPASGTTQTAVVYANTIMSLEESGNVFVPKVDIYDYYDIPNDSGKIDDNSGFNKEITKTNDNNQGFLLYANSSTNTTRRSWNKVGLYQKLSVSSYIGADTRPGLTLTNGGLGSYHSTLFPNDEKYIINSTVGIENEDGFYHGIRWYKDVEFPFFTEDTTNGYTKYTFDSNSTRIRRKDTTDSQLELIKIENGTTGFWPFNKNADLVNYESDNSKQSQKKEVKKYAFGMHMSIPFYLPANGCFDAEGTEPLVFNFRGDDDVWVYLKDEKTQKADLILDIGGIHGATEGSVNFKTKTSTVSGGNRISFDFEGGREYTLEFFFVERNPTESNCKIEIGLPVIPNSGITIGKQVQGKSESIPKDVTYSFEVYSSNDLDALKRAYTGDVDPENVNIINTIQGLNAGETKHAEFPSGDTYFFVKEVDNKKAETSWVVSGGAEEVQGATEGLVSSGACTKIYTIPEASESGVLMYCTNTFGTMKPTINKSAWKDFDATEDGIYDIALEVTGSEFESTTISGGAANVVFVLDNSGSMGTDGYKQATDAVGELMSKLPEDSYASVIAFNGKHIKDDKTPKYYYDECTGANTEYYYDTIADWTYLKTGIDDLKTKLNGSSTGSGTHSAAGFLGAIHKLRSIPDAAKENPTYVLYMTDGEPRQGIERIGTTNKKVSGTSARIVAQNILSQLDNEFPSVNVYTIAFKYDTDDKWLENSTGVDKFYNAADIDELKKTFEDITKEIKSKIPLKNVNVLDQFSTAVQPYSDTPEKYMDVWLSTEAIDKTQVGDDGKLVLDSYKTPLTEIPVSENENIIGYNYVDASNNVIAIFSLSDSTLRWAVADQLPAATTRTLIYRVKAVEPENGTLVKADKTSDTGTHYHDDELGYHSNVQATVTYDGGSQTFDHPVVVPANPDGSITITKKVENGNTDYNGQKFNFELKLDNVSSKAVEYGIVSEEGGEEKLDPSGVTRNGDVYTFQLANNETFKVIGLNKEVAYTVIEQDYDDGVYYSELKGIKASPSSATVSGKTVTGNLTDTAVGTKTVYFYIEKTSESDAGKEVIVDALGEDGWYDPYGNYVGGVNKAIGGSIPRDEEDIYEYTWSFDGKTEKVRSDGNIEGALNTVKGWLDDYQNVTVNDDYSVSYEVMEETTIYQTLHFIGGWKYDDSNIKKQVEQLGIKPNWGKPYYDLSTQSTKKSAVVLLPVASTISPSVKNVGKDYSWTYEGVSYNSAQDLISQLESEGYTVTQDPTSGTITYSMDVPMTDEELYDEGYTYREYGSRTEDVAPSNKPLHMEVEYTNTFYKRESIVIEKVIETDPGITVPDESYTFEIQDKNGTVFTAYELDFDDSLTGKVTRSEDKNRFTIQGAGEVKILLDKNLTGEKVELKVKEVSSGTADSMQWNDRSEGEPISEIVEAAVDSGGKVICTNYYFNNTLKITKKLDSASDVTLEEANAKGIKFKYVVSFTGDIEAVSYDGSIDGIVFDASNEVNTESGTIALSNKTLTFMMPAERSLQLVKIPTGVTYTVKEEKLVNAYYEDLVSAHVATPSDMSYAEATRTYSGSFSDVTTVTKNQEVGYTNKVIRSKGELKIKKNLSKADTENLVFTFEIYEKMNPNKKFYASVPVSAGNVTSEITLEVPTGDYVVKELKTLRYTVDKEFEETPVTSSIAGSVEFTNTKGGNGYFSSVSTKVNTVNEDGQGSGFPLKNDRKYNSQNALQKVVAWLGSDNKENGDE